MADHPQAAEHGDADQHHRHPAARPHALPADISPSAKSRIRMVRQPLQPVGLPPIRRGPVRGASGAGASACRPIGSHTPPRPSP